MVNVSDIDDSSEETQLFPSVQCAHAKNNEIEMVRYLFMIKRRVNFLKEDSCNMI